MMNKYQKWIHEYKGDIYRKCVEVSTEMQQVFPELRMAKGLVTIMENGKDYPHQWLLDSEGNIVDPTRKQWAGIEEYKEIKEGDPYPIGICMNCGDYVYSDSINSIACSSECLDLLDRDFNPHKYKNK